MNLDDYTKAVELQWRFIVGAALVAKDDRIDEVAEGLARVGRTSVQTVRRKIKAIRHAGESGLALDQIVQAGQSKILSDYDKARRNGHYEKQRVLSWRVSKGLADAVQSEESSPDAEEALCSRVERVCDIHTSEEWWEFILSVFADLSDKDLKHLTGEEFPKKFKKVRK